MEELSNEPLTTTKHVSNQDEQNNQQLSQQKLHQTNTIIPKQQSAPNYFYQGFWCPSRSLQNVIAFQNHFQAQDNDIIIATKPKTGTTWLKSLVFSILNRTNFTRYNHPLLTKNPHELVPFFELDIYTPKNVTPDLSSMVAPRLFSTHIPYNSLAKSIKESNCKIICMARNPFDTFVSEWKFFTDVNPNFLEHKNMEDYLETFINGEDVFGPYWDHVLGYWKESLERSDKVLFLKYEDMKENGVLEVKKLAKFLGHEFSLEEEKQGVIEDILEMCSLGNLMTMEVNKKGIYAPFMFENKMFFRKGVVGDWVNYFSSDMFEKLDKVMKEKFVSSGLNFKI